MNIPKAPRLSTFLTAATAATVLGSIGCSSSASKASATPGEGGTQETYLGLKAPTDGFQVRDIGTSIPAGTDVEYCEVAELPGTADQTYFVGGVEMANGVGSHHLILSIATPGTKSDAKLRAMSIGDRVPCVGASIAFGEDITGVGGIQRPYGAFTFPPGIARKYQGGSRVVFDYHYYNTTDRAVDARSAFNLHLTEESKVKQLAGGIGFFNWTIDTPAGKTGSFTAECRFQADATVGSLTRHTHKWGRDFSTWFLGGAHDGDLIWKTPDFETDADHLFETPVDVKAGEGFKFECDYENTETHPLRFGVKATDEMCILFGGIWDANGAYDPPHESCDITWIDPSGIGHPASYPGAFPPAAPAAAAACLAGVGAAGACSDCTCNSCGDPIVTCFTDADCAPIIQCFRNGGDCQSVIDEHSRGLGRAQQVSACMTARCDSVCGKSDGGAAPVPDGGGR